MSNSSKNQIYSYLASVEIKGLATATGVSVEGGDLAPLLPDLFCFLASANMVFV